MCTYYNIFKFFIGICLLYFFKYLKKYFLDHLICVLQYYKTKVLIPIYKLVIYKDLQIIKIKKSATSIQHSTLFQLEQIFMAQ